MSSDGLGETLYDQVGSRPTHGTLDEPSTPLVEPADRGPDASRV